MLGPWVCVISFPLLGLSSSAPPTCHGTCPIFIPTVLPSYCWAQQVSQIKPDCCLYFKAEQLDKACFKRSFLLFIENNSSQGKTELGHQCPGQNLPGSWWRGEQMEAYLDTTLDHGPDAIICKDTHVCALVADFFSLLLEH